VMTTMDGAANGTAAPPGPNEHMIMALVGALPLVLLCVATHAGVAEYVRWAIAKTSPRAMPDAFPIGSGDTTAARSKHHGTPVHQLVAYNATVLAVDLVCACLGVRAFLDGTGAALGATAHERMYGVSAEAAFVVRLTTAFELYNTLVCVSMPEYRTAAFIGHHVVTLYLALLAHAPFVHFFCLFFIGVATISTAPLCVVEICSHLRASHPAFEAAHGPMRVVFAVAFLLVRAVAWPCVSARFWIDAIEALRGGRAHSASAVLTFLIANVFLTGLQLIWGRKVAAGLIKAVRRRRAKTAKSG